jgi:hypothetical protein
MKQVRIAVTVASLLVAAAAAAVLSAPASSRNALMAGRPRGGVAAWGCTGVNDDGQCRVPTLTALSLVAVAAGTAHTLALTNGGLCSPGAVPEATTMGNAVCPR